VEISHAPGHRAVTVVGEFIVLDLLGSTGGIHLDPPMEIVDEAIVIDEYLQGGVELHCPLRRNLSADDVTTEDNRAGVEQHSSTIANLEPLDEYFFVITWHDSQHRRRAAALDRGHGGSCDAAQEDRFSVRRDALGIHAWHDQDDVAVARGVHAFLDRA